MLAEPASDPVVDSVDAAATVVFVFSMPFSMSSTVGCALVPRTFCRYSPSLLAELRRCGFCVRGGGVGRMVKRGSLVQGGGASPFEPTCPCRRKLTYLLRGLLTRHVVRKVVQLDVVHRRFGGGSVVVIVVNPRRDTLGIAAPRAPSAAARRLARLLLAAAAVVLAGIHVLQNVLITHPTQLCRKGVAAVAAIVCAAERRITLHCGVRGTVLLRRP